MISQVSGHQSNGNLQNFDKNGELEQQAQASLLWAADSPETLLRLLLNEYDIERTHEPPSGYDSDIQGEWNDKLVIFHFKREFQLIKVERDKDYFYVEY